MWKWSIWQSKFYNALDSKHYATAKEAKLILKGFGGFMIVRNLSRSLSFILLPNLFLWASCSNSNFSGDGKAKSNQGKTITPGSDGQPTDKLSTECVFRRSRTGIPEQAGQRASPHR